MKWKIAMAATAAILSFATTQGVAEGIKNPTSDERYSQLQRLIDVTQGRVLRKDDVANMDAMNASGWIVGIYETLMFEGIFKESFAKICTETEVPSVTMARIYIHYMDENPTSHTQPASTVAILSAMQAYPCQKDSK